MGRFFALSLALPQTIKPKTRPKSKMHFRPILGFWIAVLLVAVGVVYLLAVNSLSTQGYEIKRLEQALADTKNRHDRLELEAASLKSIQGVDREVRELNLVPSKNMKYLPRQGFSLK